MVSKRISASKTSKHLNSKGSPYPTQKVDLGQKKNSYFGFRGKIDLESVGHWMYPIWVKGTSLWSSENYAFQSNNRADLKYIKF